MTTLTTTPRTSEAAAPTTMRTPPGRIEPAGPREEARRPPAVDRSATLAQLVAQHAAAAAVFRKYDIDFCCRGDATVGEACREYRVRAEQLFAELERAIAAAPSPPGGSDAEQQSLVSEIVARHHAYERSALPYIASLLPKIAGRYRHRDGRLDLLCDAGQDLVETLEAYLEEEERTLLPAVAAGGCEVVRGELDRHNCELEALLAHVRSLASGYEAPQWGDRVYGVLMEELEALERDVRERVHAEDHAIARRPEAEGEPRPPTPFHGRGRRSARCEGGEHGEE